MRETLQFSGRTPASLFDFLSCGIFHSPRRPSSFSVGGRGARYSKWEKSVESTKPNSNVNSSPRSRPGQVTAQQAAREHQLSRSLIEYWREQYRNNALVDRPSKRERQLEAENERLKAKIGDLVMEMDHIKKWQAWVQRKRNADTSVITAKNLDQFRKPAK